MLKRIVVISILSFALAFVFVAIPMQEKELSFKPISFEQQGTQLLDLDLHVDLDLCKESPYKINQWKKECLEKAVLLNG